DAKDLTIGAVDVVKVFGGEFLDPTTGAAWTTPLSGVVTNNANIGLRVTSSGDLQLTHNVAAGTAGVGLESAGVIRQTGGAVTGRTLEVSAPGPVALPDANMVPVIAGQVTGPGNSFLFRNDGQGVTVGRVAALVETGTGTPPNSQMLSVAGIAGVSANSGDIVLQTTASGNLALNQAVNSRTGAVTPGSARTINAAALVTPHN